jgi:hypothetical protein
VDDETESYDDTRNEFSVNGTFLYFFGFFPFQSRIDTNETTPFQRGLDSVGRNELEEKTRCSLFGIDSAPSLVGVVQALNFSPRGPSSIMALYSDAYDEDNRSCMSSSSVDGYPHMPFPLYYDQRDVGPVYHHPNYHSYISVQQYHEQEHTPPVYMTTTIGRHDVLCGRGGATNSNNGNKVFRRLVREHKDEYLNAKKIDKPAIAARVVESVRSKGGHFLRQHGTSQDGRHIYWVEVGDDKAKEKTCQALREGAPAILRQQRTTRYSAVYSADEEDDKVTVAQSEKIEGITVDEKQMVSSTDTSSSESLSSSIEDTILRPWKRLFVPLGWDCEPISLHQLPPEERGLYLRVFLPPLPETHKKPRMLK